jgi:hypothetical protein
MAQANERLSKRSSIKQVKSIAHHQRPGHCVGVFFFAQKKGAIAPLFFIKFVLEIHAMTNQIAEL